MPEIDCGNKGRWCNRKTMKDLSPIAAVGFDQLMDTRLGPWKERALVKVSCAIIAPGNSAAVSTSGPKKTSSGVRGDWGHRWPRSSSASVDSKSQVGAELLPTASPSPETDYVGVLAHHPQPAQGLSEGDVRIGRLRACHLPGENYCSRRTLQELGKRPELEI